MLNIFKRLPVWLLLATISVGGLLSYTSVETAEGRTPAQRRLLILGGQRLPQPVIWLPMRTGELFQTVSGTAAGNGDAVGEVVARGRNTGNATQSTALDRPTASSSVPTGFDGLSLTFGGGTTQMTIADSDDFNIRDFTITTWAATDASGVSGTDRILSQQSGTYWGMAMDTGKLSALSSHDSITFPTGIGPDLRDGLWHHLAVVRDTASDRFSYYVDNVLVSSATITSNASWALGDVVRLGNYSSGFEGYKGKLKDVRLYDVALTPAQIAAIATGKN